MSRIAGNDSAKEIGMRITLGLALLLILPRLASANSELATAEAATQLQ